MAVKVVLNRASQRLDLQIARQVGRSAPRKQQVLNAFKRTGVPNMYRERYVEMLNHVHSALMAVFRGNYRGVQTPVTDVAGVRVHWDPLSTDYSKRKRTDAFWYETGDLLNYVSAELSPLAGPSAIRKMEVKAGNIRRGDRTLRVSMLYTPARLSEPLQSLVMYPFLQGRGKNVTVNPAFDMQAYKLVVNQALRGFLPEVSEAYGKHLLDELRN